MTNATLDRLVWLLIYAGAAAASLAVFALPAGTFVGGALLAGGALSMLAGALLLWLRSRRPDDPHEPPPRNENPR